VQSKKNKKEDFDKIIEDPDAEEGETLLDPRDRYNGEVDEVMGENRAKINFFGHIFMFVLLVQILILYFKNNYFYTNDTFTYLIALAIPASILVLLAAVVIYQKYIVKLNDSHSRVHTSLTTLLVVVALCLVAFFVLLSLFFTSTTEKEWLYLSAIPYYVSLVLITGFFIYVSPGLLDSLNGIEFHQFLLICLYLIFLFAYPIVYTMIVLQSNSNNEVGGDDDSDKKDPNQ